jgi:hypothetical protein
MTEPQGAAAVPGSAPPENTPGGVAFVPELTELTRLNYFDGKFLRADDLVLEQNAQRSLIHLSNQAGGAGVVRGFDLSAASNTMLGLSAGLAIDPGGRVLHLPLSVTVSVADLLSAASGPKPAAGAGAGGSAFTACEPVPTAPGTAAPLVEGVQLFVVGLAHAEALCGHEEVFGRMCQQTCATAADRPYRHEGVAVLLQPLPLGPLDPTTGGVTLTEVHLRSRVASRWFAAEQESGGSWLSAAGLGAAGWCQGAAGLAGSVVPVGVLAWRNSGIVFVDPWTVRRERMEAQARQYWAGRLESRPWPVFLAQVLQFQCQLATAPGGAGLAAAYPYRDLLGESARLIDSLVQELGSRGGVPDGGAPRGAGASPAGSRAGAAAGIGAAALADFRARAFETLEGPGASATGSTLIDRGFAALPPAGFLPVDANAADSLQAQLAPVFGTGVDLRICSVRRDQIPREFETAQHLNRISLLQGRSDPKAVENVDILVPDGRTEEFNDAAGRFGFAADLIVGARVRPRGPDPLSPTPEPGGVHEPLVGAGQLHLRGAGRWVADNGGFSAHLAVAASGQNLGPMLRLFATFTSDTEATLTRARRIKTSPTEPDRADLRRLAEAMTAEFAAAPSGTARRMRVVSLASDAGAEALPLWATCWIGADPFTAPQGRRIPVSFTADVFTAGSSTSSLVEHGFSGQAMVMETDRGSGSVTLRIKGIITRSTVNVRPPQNAERSIEFDVLLQRAEKEGKTILVIFGIPRTAWEVRLSWFGDPVHVQGQLVASRSTVAGAAQTIAALDAVEDPAVAQPGNLHHDLAVDALTILQGAKLDDPFFLDNARRALFPVGGGTRRRVRPTTDWVLFRRRIVKTCEDVVMPPVLATSKVAVFVTTVANKDAAQAEAELLRSGFSEIAWRSLGVVEFDGGTALFRSYPSSLAQDYLAAGGGNHLAFVGYGPALAGDWTGIARARRLVDALAPDAFPDEKTVDLLPRVSKAAPGTEASVLLLSYESPEEETCIEVGGVDLTEEIGRELAEAIRNADLATFERLSGAVQALGNVTFNPEAREAQVKAIIDQLPQSTGEDSVFAWIAADLSEDQVKLQGTRLQTLAKSLRNLPVRKALTVAFSRERRCSARLYVLLGPRP